MFRICKNLAFLGLLKPDKLISNKGTCRHFFNPLVLNLLDFQQEQEHWQRRAGHAKERFFSRVEEALKKHRRLFTEDIKVLCCLADKENEFKLAIESMQRYLEDQEKSTFQTLSYNAAGEMLLSMLHIHKQDQLAYSWFLDEKSNVNIFGRNKECFLLMMDLLYECGRYQDVISLMSQTDQYIDRRYPDLVTITLAALYKLNTPDSLAQLHTLLGELCLNPIQLTSRSAMYCALLAYNQGDIDMIREIPHLPLFAMCYRKLINPLSNIDILAYTELGRYEDAVDILKDVVVRFKKSAYIFFPEVIAKLESAVMSTDNVRLQDEFKVVHKALKLGEFIYYSSVDEFLSRQVSYKEYDMLMNTKNPRQFSKQTFSLSRSSKSDNNLLTVAKQIT